MDREYVEAQFNYYFEYEGISRFNSAISLI